MSRAVQPVENLKKNICTTNRRKRGSVHSLYMYVIQDAAGNTEQTLRQKPYALLLLVLKLQCLWGNGLGHYASSQEFVLQKHAELMLCISISVGTLFLRSQLSNTACTPCN